MKVAESDPAATVALPGTEADALLDVRETVAPSAKAKPVKVTVPVEEAPPTAVAGDIATEESVGGGGGSAVIVKAAVRSTPPWLAVMVATSVVLTVVVVTAKVALVAPEATVTLEVTTAEGMLEESVTRAPPVGAARVSVTVPDALTPP